MNDHREPQAIRRVKALLVGPRPPPINGMSYAFNLLVSGLDPATWSLEVVDTAEKSAGRRTGAFSLNRLFSAMSAVLTAWVRVPFVDVVYVPISQSRLGFVKDALILAAAHMMHRPVVVHLHGGNFDRFYSAQSRFYRFLIRALLKPACAFVVLSDSLRDSFFMVPGARDRTIVVPNACDLDPSPPRPAPHGRVRLLYLSNLIVEKGYLDALEALPLLASKLPGVAVELHLAGAFVLAADQYSSVAEMQADLSARISRIASAATVVWHGTVAGAEKRALLAQADVFLLPTYYAAEGQPIAIIEAMTAGLPVIATDYRSIPDTLPSSMHWCFVPPRTPSAIADRVAKLVSDGRLYEQMSTAAVECARLYQPAKHIERMSAVLRSPLRTPTA